jgi:PIN domain nuclease of toxin-antitoxin system
VKLLLDTATILWAALDDDRLSPAAREAILDPANERWISSISAWEIAIKYGLGKLALPEPPARWFPATRRRLAAEALPLNEGAALLTDRLPSIHRDPFDRALVCQALHHDLVIATSDPMIARYPVQTLW